jgi:hypothetical protein
MLIPVGEVIYLSKIRTLLNVLRSRFKYNRTITLIRSATISDAKYQYLIPSKYTPFVKAIDTFGCDTSITVEVEV